MFKEDHVEGHEPSRWTLSAPVNSQVIKNHFPTKCNIHSDRSDLFVLFINSLNIEAISLRMALN